MRTFPPPRHTRIATRPAAWIALGFFGTLLLLMLLLTRIGAIRVLDAVRWYGELSYVDRSIRWDGRIALKGAAFRPHGGSELGIIEADRVTIDAGGPVWLMRLVLGNTSSERLERLRKELEAQGVLVADEVPTVLPVAHMLTVNAEEVSFGVDAAPVRWLPWLDPASGVLFATLGCRDIAGLRDAVSARAGDSGALQVQAVVSPRDSGAQLEVTFALGGISTAMWKAHILPPADASLLGSDWRQWQLAEQEWKLKDRPFVRARNRECAHRLAMARPQFMARHAIAVRRQLANWRIALPEPLEQAYREHASIGGEIVVRSRPARPIRLGDYRLLSRTQKLGVLSPEITIAGHQLPLLLEFLPERRPAIIIASWGGKSMSMPETASTRSSMRTMAAAVRPAPSGLGSTALPATPTPVSGNASSRRSVLPTASAGSFDALAAETSAPSTTARPPATSRPAIPAAPDPAAAEPAKPPLAPVEETVAAAPDADFRRFLGRRVSITTTLGTSRTGRVTIANNVALTLETQTAGGPIQLRIPVEQIVRVAVIR